MVVDAGGQGSRNCWGLDIALMLVVGVLVLMFLVFGVASLLAWIS
jgi:hypothetical protein